MTNTDINELFLGDLLTMLRVLIDLRKILLKQRNCFRNERCVKHSSRLEKEKRERDHAQFLTSQLGFGMIVGMLAFMRVHKRLIVAVTACNCVGILVRVLLGRVLWYCLEVFCKILECNHLVAVL